MLEATNELQPRMSRPMQAAYGEHTRCVDAVAVDRGRRDASVDDLLQPPSAVSSPAGYADMRRDQVGTRMAAVEARLGIHEDLQRRVTYLEQAR